MPVIVRSARRSLCVALAAVLVITGPGLVSHPAQAVFAGSDDEGDGKKKKSVFNKLKKAVKKRTPRARDRPEGAVSSSSTSSFRSKPTKLSRVDARRNLVPVSADEERAARSRLDRLERTEGSNPRVRGYYEQSYDANLLATNGRNPERGRPGLPPDPEGPVNQTMLTLLAAGFERQDSFNQSGASEPSRAFLELNQNLVNAGIVVLPTGAQLLAMQDMVKDLNSGVPFAQIDSDTRDAVAGYLSLNSDLATFYRDEYERQRSTSRLGGQREIDAARTYFGAADRESYPAEENVAPPAVANNGAYDLPGAPLRFDDNSSDDGDEADDEESSDPPPAPDEVE